MVLLGPPGAGKGTQAKLLCERLGIAHVSTGDLFRRAIDAGTPAGAKARSYVESGHLVPDDLVLEIVANYVAEQGGSGMCFDGFPRTHAQAEALDEVLARHSTSVSVALILDLADDVALDRLVGRGRVDDDDTTVRHRLELYHEMTEPLVSYFKQFGLVRRFNGDANIHTVSLRIDEALEGVAA